MSVWYQWMQAIGLRKRSDASVQSSPARERILYYSTDQDAFAYKTPGGTVKALAARTQAAGVVPSGVYEARPLSAGTDEPKLAAAHFVVR